MKILKLVLLGRPQIFLGDKPIPGLKSHKAQALIFYLAVTCQEYTREELAGLLWPEKTEKRARNNLRVEVTRLRSLISEHLEISRRSLKLNSESQISCDVTEFLKAVDSKNPTLQELQKAVSLYHGDFLESFTLIDTAPFEDWIMSQRAYCRSRVLEALYQITKYHGQEKRYDVGIKTIRRLLTLDPWLEKAHRELMWLLAKNGNRTAALNQFESCQALLADELGVTPEAKTIQLYEQIKSGELGPYQDYSEKDSLKIAPPFQAPKLIDNFLGREKALSWLKSKFRAATKPLSIVGMGGLGKTTLAISVCHELRKEWVHGVLWADVGIMDPKDILEDWAQAFGYDFSRLPDIESMAAAFQGIIADKNMLLVLDGVMSVARVRPLLPVNPNIKVLVTTRKTQLAYQLSNEVFELDELSSTVSVELLEKFIGEKRIQTEKNAAVEIANLLQHLPLALEIIGQRLRLFKSMTLAEMATRLRNERQRLATLENENQAVRASFTLSYRALDSYEKRAFILMGVFNGRSFSREAFADIAKLDYFTAGDRLFSLEGSSLVQVRENARFQQHALLADFARELLLEEDAIEEVYNHFAQHYLRFAQHNNTDYLVLQPEWENMMAAMETAYNLHLRQDLLDFVDTLSNAWFARGRYSQARQGYKWANEVILHLKDGKKRGHYLLNWAKSCIEQNDFEEAKLLLQDCLSIFQKNKDLADTARAQALLTRIALDQSDYEEATRLAKTLFTVNEQLNDDAGMAEAIEMKARTQYRQQKFQDAHDLAQTALSLYEKAGEELGILQTLGLLVNIQIELRDRQTYLDQALQYGQQALEMANKLQDTGEQAVALLGLSRANLFLKKIKQAQEQAQQSKVLFNKIGDRRSEANVIIHLSEIHFYQEEYERALELAYSINVQIEMLGAKDMAAVNWWNIGHFHRLLEEPDQAKIAWSKAYQIAKEIEHTVFIERLEGLI